MSLSHVPAELNNQSPFNKWLRARGEAERFCTPKIRTGQIMMAWLRGIKATGFGSRKLNEITRL